MGTSRDAEQLRARKVRCRGGLCNRLVDGGEGGEEELVVGFAGRGDEVDADRVGKLLAEGPAHVSRPADVGLEVDRLVLEEELAADAGAGLERGAGVQLTT